jgi:hypothetical protein
MRRASSPGLPGDDDMKRRVVFRFQAHSMCIKAGCNLALINYKTRRHNPFNHSWTMGDARTAFDLSNHPRRRIACLAAALFLAGAAHTQQIRK